jgi:hypothetical protein
MRGRECAVVRFGLDVILLKKMEEGWSEEQQRKNARNL